MNKKFSTLLAGVALLGAMSAHAGAPVKSLKKTGNNLYQLEAPADASGAPAKGVLSMGVSGKLGIETTVTAGNLANTLWCVEVISEGLGKAPTYNFINKATGQRLDIQYSGSALMGLADKASAYTNTGDSTVVGGEISDWAFSTQYVNDLKPGTLYSYFKPDSVIGLLRDGSGIKIKKMSGAAAAADAAAGLELTQFTLIEADVLQLNAAMINTLFGQQAADKGASLTFAPDEKGPKIDVPNPFNGKNGKFLTAEIDPNTPSDYVHVTNMDGTKYLRVDTAFVNKEGQGFLAYKWVEITADNKDAELKSGALSGQYQFAFSFYPSLDSVVIQVASRIDYTALADGNNSHWYTAHTATTLPKASGAVKGENNFVTIQDLVKDQVSIITIADRKDTKISLGYTGCTPAVSNKTTVGNGLYIIKNAKDQVLAAPIHKNGVAIEWVTLNAQAPEHMPAYQWVVYQNQAGLTETSTITLVNREFDSNTTVAQLYKNEAGAIEMPAGSKLFSNDASGKLTFTQIKDSAIIKDELLGYKHVEAADLQVAQFKFNYFHSFNQNKWINLTSSKDSVLYVQDDNGLFTLEKAATDKVKYGITDATVLAKVKGLAQLVRTPYKVVKSGKYLVTAAEDKYAVGAANADKSDVDLFYFKENNHFVEGNDGKHYYAIVKADASNAGVIAAEKVGIADDGITNALKVQDLAETRTSAFTVERMEAPLYRRFAYDALGKIEGRDTMRFIEKYRGEMLQLEGNANFKVTGVDFLGINQESKAPSGLAFIVDTAWVGRGLGYIKPQYLISIDRNDIKGTPFQRCAECQRLIEQGLPPIENCKHDIQATPDMNFGKYLVNFADSVALGKTIGATNKGYNWKEYDRAGFVKAIQYGDSLYILKGAFAGVEKKDMNLALLAKIVKANATADAKEGYIINLTKDNHKYATWSMRFIKPGTDDKSFLVESMKYLGADNKQNDIAPEYAAWLKMQNGCLVLSDSKTSSFNQFTGGDDALIFDIKRVPNDPIVTENEDIAASNVAIIAGEGAVTINGAAGKQVVVSNILGQALVNTVLASDNATIAVPQGAVIVAVEGEAAVKAMVK